MQRHLLRGALLLAVGLTMLAPGCRGRRARLLDARAARVSTVSTVQLTATVQRDTGCPAAQVATAQINASPPVYTVQACGTSAEYWGLCDGRGCQWSRIADMSGLAAGPLSCGASTIVEQPTGQPLVRNAVGCGRMLAFTLMCTPSSCSWSQTGPVQGSGGFVATNTPPPPPPTGSGPGANLQAQITTQRDAILSCVDVPSFNLTLRWTPEGQVTVQLPPEIAGTSAEGCVQAAVGQLSVRAEASGQVIIPVQ